MRGKTVPRSIHVYNDDPVWERFSRWFLVPQPDLSRLYVASYDVAADADGDVDMCSAARQVSALHPGCVLIYVKDCPDSCSRCRVSASSRLANARRPAVVS